MLKYIKAHADPLAINKNVNIETKASKEKIQVINHIQNMIIYYK